MTMIDAPGFKARFLAILDRIHGTGERAAILKRGRPVGERTGATGESERRPQTELDGTLVILGDVVEPVFPEEHWDSLKR